MKHYVALFIIGLIPLISTAQVGIGTTNPNLSSILDVDSSTSGILIPRVSLNNVTNNASPISAPALSLLVFNTNASVIGGNGTGFYYWNGTQWTQLLTSTDDKWTRNTATGVMYPTNLGDKIGIGTSNPNAPLSFAPTLEKKITLYPGATGDVGFGVAGNLLKIYSDYSGADIGFGYDNTGTFNEKVRIKGNGNVGIGTNPNAPLQFSNSTVNRKIVLYDGANNDHQFYGFGINGGTLRYQTDATSADHVFFSGINASSSSELMRIKGNGNVGIGTNNPSSKLEIGGAGVTELKISSTFGFGQTRFSMYSDRGSANEWRPAYIEDADNGGFTGRLDFYTNGTGFANRLGSTHAMSVTNGKVGIGTTNPATKLDVLGTVKITDGTQGSNKVLTSDANGYSSWQNIGSMMNTFYAYAPPNNYTSINPAAIKGEITQNINVPVKSRLIISASGNARWFFVGSPDVITTDFYVRIDGVNQDASRTTAKMFNSETSSSVISNFMVDVNAGAHTIEFVYERTYSSVAVINDRLEAKGNYSTTIALPIN